MSIFACWTKATIRTKSVATVSTLYIILFDLTHDGPSGIMLNGRGIERQTLPDLKDRRSLMEAEANGGCPGLRNERR